MDGDYYAPTFRRIIGFTSSDEMKNHIYATPQGKKLTSLTEDNFHRLSHSIHDCIDHTGIIVIDGVGMHTNSTDSLLELANMLIVLSPINFNINKSSKKCCYLKKGKLLHPFDFYNNRRNRYIKIETHYQNKKAAYFNEKELMGELYDLERKSIKDGSISKIPIKTREVIKKIAEFILNEWFI